MHDKPPQAYTPRDRERLIESFARLLHRMPDSTLGVMIAAGCNAAQQAIRADKGRKYQ